MKAKSNKPVTAWAGNYGKSSFSKWITKQVDFFRSSLCLDRQKISVESSDTVNYMEITCTYPYLEPTIRYSRKAEDDWRKGKLDRYRILHELCHIITDPLYVKAITRFAGKSEIEDERELLTDKFAIIIRGLIERP